jgi:hypothetical protein
MLLYNNDAAAELPQAIILKQILFFSLTIELRNYSKWSCFKTEVPSVGGQNADYEIMLLGVDLSSKCRYGLVLLKDFKEHGTIKIIEPGPQDNIINT